MYSRNKKQKNNNSKKIVTSNFKARLISGLLIVAIFLFSILYSTLLYMSLIIVIAQLMALEWHQMSKGNSLLHIVVTTIGVLGLLCLAQNHKMAMLYYSTVWTIDVMAYVGGSIIGGPRLAPIISPRKTWSGLVCGMAGAALIQYIFRYLHHGYIAHHPVTFGIALGIACQCSDLYVSYFKRKYKVKDTGNIIPGHGGVLDRFDSTLLTSVPFYILTSI